MCVYVCVCAVLFDLFITYIIMCEEYIHVCVCVCVCACVLVPACIYDIRSMCVTRVQEFMLKLKIGMAHTLIVYSIINTHKIK